MRCVVVKARARIIRINCTVLVPENQYSNEVKPRSCCFHFGASELLGIPIVQDARHVVIEGTRNGHISAVETLAPDILVVVTYMFKLTD